MIQHSVASRTAQAQAHETTIGTAPILRLRTGSAPANCAASRTGSILVAITLPSDWVSASSGALSLASSWSATATGTGTAGHYEIVDSAGTTCHEQGTVTASGGGGDMELSQATAAIVSGQVVTVSSYTQTWGNS